MVGLIFVCSKWQDLFILEIGLNFISPICQNLTVGLIIVSSNWQDLGILEVGLNFVSPKQQDLGILEVGLIHIRQQDLFLSPHWQDLFILEVGLIIVTRIYAKKSLKEPKKILSIFVDKCLKNRQICLLSTNEKTRQNAHPYPHSFL